MVRPHTQNELLSRMAKRILDWKQKRSRQTERPRIRWLDDVMIWKF